MLEYYFSLPRSLIYAISISDGFFYDATMASQLFYFEKRVHDAFDFATLGY